MEDFFPSLYMPSLLAQLELLSVAPLPSRDFLSTCIWIPRYTAAASIISTPTSPTSVRTSTSILGPLVGPMKVILGVDGAGLGSVEIWRDIKAVKELG